MANYEQFTRVNYAMLTRGNSAIPTRGSAYMPRIPENWDYKAKAPETPTFV